jgi:LysM repeat protein
LELRLKALEEHRKQVDARVEGLTAKAALAPPKVATDDKKSPAVALAPPKVQIEDKKPAASGPGKGKITHKVKKGETLIVIARKYRVSTQDIVQWNKLAQGGVIKQDDKLVIYVKK